jgi:hypothetical protein
VEPEPLAALPLLEPLGVEDEPLAGGVLLEPLDALPDGEDGEVVAEPLPLVDPLVEPPDAESFLFASADEDELEDDGELGVVAPPDIEPDAEPEGELGEVLEPADDEAPEPGAVEVREALSLSPHAATPSARETAAARIESFMCGPPWLG